MCGTVQNVAPACRPQSPPQSRRRRYPPETSSETLAQTLPSAIESILCLSASDSSRQKKNRTKYLGQKNVKHGKNKQRSAPGDVCPTPRRPLLPDCSRHLALPPPGLPQQRRLLRNPWEVNHLRVPQYGSTCSASSCLEGVSAVRCPSSSMACTKPGGLTSWLSEGSGPSSPSASLALPTMSSCRPSGPLRAQSGPRRTRPKYLFFFFFASSNLVSSLGVRAHWRQKARVSANLDDGRA